jgi:valyl-tRNA synthetase
VQQVDVKGHLWHFNYPVEGETYDPENPATFITVATTRPETMLGDSAVAVHPENPRLAPLIGRHVILPLVGRRIPVVGDEYADPEKGTGAVKITPAHDFNDFEVGRRHDLPLINIFDQEARLVLKENPGFLADVPESTELAATLGDLDGLDRFIARKQIVARMEAAGFCPKIEPYAHTVPHGDRSGVVIEPWLTDQWYVDAKTLAEPAIAAVRSGATTFVPKNWEKTYFDWLENIQPWCVSRQLWWGHQIPAWYSPWGGVYVAETEEEAFAAALADGVERDALSVTEANSLAEDIERLRETIRRDEDVLDTWFSSALWPFSTMGWPGDDDPALARFYPTSVLVTGFDIIFFWVARMMMMGLHFMKEVPFRDVYIHALVRDEKGAKMSKSKGNVIDPLGLIDQYGADALRFTLAAMAAQGRDIKLATSRVEGYRNFATKLWNAARFAEMNGCARAEWFAPGAVEQTLNRWIVGEVSRATREVTNGIVAYRFNDAANAAYRFVWNVFCDWYLELAKPILQGPDGRAKDETRATAAWTLDEIARLLHPFMPFITEELWAINGRTGPARSQPVLALAGWPDHAGLENAEAEAEIGFVVDLVSEIRSVRSEMSVPASAQMRLAIVAADLQMRTRLVPWIETMKRMARLSEVAFETEPPGESAQMIVRGATAALPLAGVIDVGAEKARLAKEIAKEEKEVSRVDAKLGNADFVARAPEEVVEENRERRQEALDRIARMQAALQRLG